MIIGNFHQVHAHCFRPNDEHLAILERGVAEWNRWRQEKPNVRPYLYSAQLRSDDPTGRLFLRRSLTGIDFSAADLTEANLRGADLTRANLAKALLHGTDLSDSLLSDASLEGAVLSGANLSGAVLTGANLASATIGETIFARCRTLHEARGLDLVNHAHPSSLDLTTLRDCAKGLPSVFFKGTGYTAEEVQSLLLSYRTAARSLSCFISYARSDDDFAESLLEGLETRGVQCWKDTHHLRAGDYWRRQIADAIRLHDKVLLVCSENSLLRSNVVEEILAAMRHERESGKRKLVPIALDDFVYRRSLPEEAAASLPDPLLREEWCRYVQEYHIPDFSRWRSAEFFARACEKLVQDLRK